MLVGLDEPLSLPVGILLANLLANLGTAFSELLVGFCATARSGPDTLVSISFPWSAGPCSTQMGQGVSLDSQT
jgi:hypothetical protein